MMHLNTMYVIWLSGMGIYCTQLNVDCNHQSWKYWGKKANPSYAKRYSDVTGSTFTLGRLQETRMSQWHIFTEKSPSDSLCSREDEIRHKKLMWHFDAFISHTYSHHWNQSLPVVKCSLFQSNRAAFTSHSKTSKVLWPGPLKFVIKISSLMLYCLFVLRTACTSFCIWLFMHSII